MHNIRKHINIIRKRLIEQVHVRRTSEVAGDNRGVGDADSEAQGGIVEGQVAEHVEHNVEYLEFEALLEFVKGERVAGLQDKEHEEGGGDREEVPEAVHGE